jgi:hypothetical protein
MNDWMHKGWALLALGVTFSDLLCFLMYLNESCISDFLEGGLLNCMFGLFLYTCCHWTISVSWSCLVGGFIAHLGAKAATSGNAGLGRTCENPCHCALKLTCQLTCQLLYSSGVGGGWINRPLPSSVLISKSFHVHRSTRWFKYDWDWLRLVYTQISPDHIWITLYFAMSVYASILI